MAYIANLNDLELDQYSNGDLLELMDQILEHVGSEGAWHAIDAAASGLTNKVGSSVVLIAVRNNPDDPNQLERITFHTNPPSLEALQKVTIPLLAAAAVGLSKAGPIVCDPLGIGPAGFIEMLRREYSRQTRRPDGDPGVDFTVVG